MDRVWTTSAVRPANAAPRRTRRKTPVDVRKDPQLLHRTCTQDPPHVAASIEASALETRHALNLIGHGGACTGTEVSI